MPTPASEENTLPMTVANTGFMLDRLGQDCGPLQFVRELTQNAIEAIEATPKGKGEVIWDVDWHTLELTGNYKLSVTDNGSGMTGDDMVRYINALSSSVHQQSHEGNFGVGAKIAAATRNHAGLVYLSWVDGAGATIHMWRDEVTGEYGLRQMRVGDEAYVHWAHIEDTVKPALIKTHGTRVVLMGMTDDENTMQAPEGAPTPSQWLTKYLNTRYFRFPTGVTVKAREGWEFPRSDQKRNLLRTIKGQEAYLRSHAESSGSVRLTGATAHWWILAKGKQISADSGRVASGGHSAALYNNELYEMTLGRSGVARLQLFGVIFGHQRVVVYVEPGGDVSSNTARTALLINGEPLPWADWAAEFRDRMPAEIVALMEDVTAGTSSGDHRQAIRERLRAIKDLLKITRYRAVDGGESLIEVPRRRRGGSMHVDGDDTGGERSTEATEAASAEEAPTPRPGSIYSMFLTEGGTPGEVADSDDVDRAPKVDWVTVAEGTRSAGDLEDRAARFLYEQNRLLINGDFRVFNDMVERWHKQYSDVPGSRDAIMHIVREWFEQTLVETVISAQSLHGQRWTQHDVRAALSEEALSAAVLPRYHIDVAIKRAVGSRLGSLKDRAAS